MKVRDCATDRCRQGYHEDDNSGMCVHCAVILNPEPDEDPNDYRRSYGWPPVPTTPDEVDGQR
jgi:hypothetical protein